MSTPTGGSSTASTQGSEIKRTKDIGWKYGTLVNPNNRDWVRCNFCQKDCRGGIHRLKQHLAGTSTNVTSCLKVTPEAKEEILEHLQQSKQAKIEKKCLIMEAENRHDLLGQSVSKGSSIEMNPLVDDVSSRPPRFRGPLDKFCNVNPEDSKGKSIKDKKHEKEARERVIQYIARWMYQAGISFNTVRLNSFQTMLEAIGQFGPGLKGPTYHEIRETLLQKEIEKTEELVAAQKASWVKHGCTIMSDAWTDGRGRTLVNFLVNSPTGTVFLRSIDASHHVKDAKLLADLLDKIVIEVGVGNVIQIVTDNEASYVAAGKMLMAAHPHLFWTPCAAHCIDLILEDISKMSPIKSTIQRAKMVTTFIYGHTRVLAMMRKYTNEKNLVRAAVTRFATNYLNLQSLLDCKDGLRRMFTSADWTASNNRWGKKNEGKKAQEIILKTSFWAGVVYSLKIFKPLVLVLRLVDGEKPAMGYIYEAMDRAKESIKNALNAKIEKYGQVWEVIDRRWDFQLHRPLHAAGYYLNPQFYYSNPEIDSDGEVKQGLYDCIEKIVPDPKTQDEITKELACYRNALGFFGREMAIRQRATSNPVNWWLDYGSKTPHLQKMAIRILSLTCSASSCERNWSTFEQVHTKKRNRLEQKKLNDLVYVQYNQRLRDRFLRFHQSDVDPISLDEIDDCNEWITHPREDEEFVHEDDDLTWLEVEIASGINEEEGPSTRLASKKRRLAKGKGVATSSPLEAIDEAGVDSDETTEEEVPIEEDDDDYESDE